MINFGIQNTETVGIDIGSYSVKVVSVKNSPSKSTLSAYNIKEIPREEAGIPMHDVVKSALEEIELHPDRVNVSISGPDVIVRFIEMPKMTREQLKNALSFEAEKYIPFDVREVVVDFEILGDAKDAGKMKVLLAVAKNEVIEQKVKVLDELGILVKAVDIDSLAMFNTYLAASPGRSDDEKSIAFIDLGHSQTSVVIATGDVPCFIRQIQIGSKDIADAVRRMENAASLPGGEVSAGGKDPRISALNDLIEEIHLSCGYFENRCGSSVGAIYCSGGASSDNDLIKYITGKFSCPVEKWDPFKGIELSESLPQEDLKTVSAQLAVGLGLALRRK